MFRRLKRPLNGQYNLTPTVYSLNVLMWDLLFLLTPSIFLPFMRKKRVAAENQVIISNEERLAIKSTLGMRTRQEKESVYIVLLAPLVAAAMVGLMPHHIYTCYNHWTTDCHPPRVILVGETVLKKTRPQTRCSIAFIPSVGGVTVEGVGIVFFPATCPREVRLSHP